MTEKASPRAGIGGPKTEEGKKRSSLNALKHGLTARSPQALNVPEGETGVEFDWILRRMRRYYRPADPVEEELVRRIARCVWRLAQSEAMERRHLTRSPNLYMPDTWYKAILRFERVVDIHLHRAIRALIRKRAAEGTKK